MKKFPINSVVRIRAICMLIVCAALFWAIPLDAAPDSGGGKNDTDAICAVYITGIGCGNCAVTDPIIFTQLTAQYPQLIVIEYEIYRSRQQNSDVKDAYFRTFIPFGRTGVPFLVFNKNQVAVGRFQVMQSFNTLKMMESNPCPSREGLSIPFSQLDLTKLPGKFVLWTKNRVLVPGNGGNNKVLTRLLTATDVSQALRGVTFKQVDPIPMPMSSGEVPFEHAVMVDGWRLQWNGEPVTLSHQDIGVTENTVYWILITCVFIGMLVSVCRIERRLRGWALRFALRGRRKDYFIVGASALGLLLFLMFSRTVSPDALEQSGYRLPLPVFTFIIALIDGFNPCNMFILISLLVLLIATSESKLRLYVVAFSFLFMVFTIYFLFMAAWLNVFKYLSFVRPLRIGIALVAIGAGIINCKELLFFKKGVSLMIQEGHKGPLLRKIGRMREIVKTGSFPLLISSSLGLAALSSLVELPCTAGFPIIYTGILSGRMMHNTVGYYAYLFLYNLVYVLPLVVIITVFIYTFRARQVTERQVQIMKFIGGLIMILLGIVLLANPGLIGLGIE